MSSEPFCGDNISIGKVHKENEQRVKRTEKREKFIYIYIYTQLFMCSGRVHDPTSQFSLPSSFCMQIQAPRGHRSFLRPWPPSVQYWVCIPLKKFTKHNCRTSVKMGVSHGEAKPLNIEVCAKVSTPSYFIFGLATLRSPFICRERLHSLALTDLICDQRYRTDHDAGMPMPD